MTMPEIKDRLAEIEKHVDLGDFETAHIQEDRLYICFLLYVADGGKRLLARKADLVLAAREIDFPRRFG